MFEIPYRNEMLNYLVKKTATTSTSKLECLVKFALALC